LEKKHASPHSEVGGVRDGILAKKRSGTGEEGAELHHGEFTGKESALKKKKMGYRQSGKKKAKFLRELAPEDKNLKVLK